MAEQTFPAEYVARLRREGDDLRQRLAAADARLAGETQIEALRAEGLRLKRELIARAHGLGAIADRLRGDDEQAITEDARKLARSLPWHREGS